MGDADRSDRHLSRAGKDVGTVGNESFGGLRGELHIGKRFDVDDGNFRASGFCPEAETVDVQLRVADLDRSDNANTAALVPQQRHRERIHPHLKPPCRQTRSANQTCQPRYPRQMQYRGSRGLSPGSGRHIASRVRPLGHSHPRRTGATPRQHLQR